MIRPVTRQRKLDILISGIVLFVGYAIGYLTSMAFYGDDYSKPSLVVYIIVTFVWFFVSMSFMYFWPEREKPWD